MKFQLVAPTYITIPMKKVPDKNIGLSLNWYRNAHYMQSNKVKLLYKQSIAKQILALPKLGQVSILFEYFSKTKQKSDVDNWCSVNNKFFQDALVSLDKLWEDNYTIVPEVTYRWCGKDPDKKGKIVITITEIL